MAVRAKTSDLLDPLRHRDFRLIWGSQLCSELGDWAARLALAVFVERRTGSPALVALVTAASVVPFLGPGQFLTARLDRFPRRHVVVASDLARAAVFALLALGPPTPVLLLGAFVAGMFTPPFEASRSALMASSVPSEAYGDAVALAQITFQGSILFGYGLGGVFVAALGPQPALLANAVTFVASAALLLAMQSGRVAVSSHEDPVTLREGWAAVRSDQFLWTYTTTWSVLAACTVVPESLVAAYGPEVLGRDDYTVAILAAAIPLGAIFGIGAFRRRGRHDEIFRRALTLAAGGAGCAAVLFALGPAMPLAALCFLAVGVFNASHVPANEVTALRLQDRTRASAFSIFAGALVGSQALGATLGGVVARWLGVRQAIAIAMAVALVASLAGLARAPHGRHAITRSEPTGPPTGQD